jgi:Rrf2 family nitric oxide-sensitive transcriptional repressor
VGHVQHTYLADYAIRVLLYLRVNSSARATTAEMAGAHDISRAHLDKVVQRLARAGLVVTSRGRGGGVELARDGTLITVGEVMRAMEDDFAVVECLGHSRYCRVAGVCGARNVFAQALEAYFQVLDGATLEDIAENDLGLRGALGLTQR